MKAQKEKYMNDPDYNHRNLGNLAQAELDLRRFVQVGIEILEARDKGLSAACDALIDKSLRRLVREAL